MPGLQYIIKLTVITETMLDVTKIHYGYKFTKIWIPTSKHGEEE